MGKLAKLWVVCLIYILVSVVFIAPIAPEETSYTYEIKAQQAYDVDRVSDSDVTQLENLSADEQDLLYDAFKRTDHFMGASEVTIFRDEQLDTFTTWKTIESNGIVLLVAVNEDRETTFDLSVPWVKYWGVGIFGSLAYILTGIMMLPVVDRP